MRSEPKDIEKLVITEVMQILTETGDLTTPQVAHLEAPDFVVTDGALKIGIELVSYNVDAVCDGKHIRSKIRTQWHKQNSSDAQANKAFGNWIGISKEVIETAIAKGDKLPAYRENSHCSEFWLVIHSENALPFEELGSESIAPLQNINFQAVIQHHLHQIAFDRIYLYDIKHRGLFGGRIRDSAKRTRDI